MARTFASAAAFKAALEAHLRKLADQQHVPFATLQLRFVMERLLARLFREGQPPWVLKGGFALDLRFRPRARTTKDVDLSVTLTDAGTGGRLIAALRERLQAAAEADLGDYLSFRIGQARRELTNAPQGGGRFPCEAVLVGKVYARFPIDVGCGDAVVEGAERLTGGDFLSFAGIAPATPLVLPVAQQFAEKVHAYTFPWLDRPNTRSKDLVDLVLLIEQGPPETEALRRALAATFGVRGSHPLPSALPPPPAHWEGEFEVMAREAGLTATSCGEAFAILGRFWHSLGIGSRPEESAKE